MCAVVLLVGARSEALSEMSGQVARRVPLRRRAVEKYAPRSSAGDRPLPKQHNVSTGRDGADRADWSATLSAALGPDGGASVQAFEAIYGGLSPSVASYLRMNGVADVDGVTNEVFLQVHRGLPRFQGDWPAFRSWVFTIAHHRMVDETRRAVRRLRVVPMDDLIDGPTGNAELDALDAMADARLRALLDGLSEDQRAVLLLRISSDLSLERVAEVLGKSLGAVKALQHRALANLRRALDTEEAGT